MHKRGDLIQLGDETAILLDDGIAKRGHYIFDEKHCFTSWLEFSALMDNQKIFVTHGSTVEGDFVQTRKQWSFLHKTKGKVILHEKKYRDFTLLHSDV